MKEGWEYKKLGEVASIKSGKSIDACKIRAQEDSLYPCYGGNGIRGYVDSYSYDGLIPIIGRVGALCGNVHLAKGKIYATEHALVVDIKTNEVSPNWLTQCLVSLNLRKYAKGVAQPVLSAGEVSKITISIPPLSDQQHIVEELDLLSSIIEKKKAQLNELDNLAQSLFYEMFGDPITNEKGWEVKKVIDVVKLQRGFDLPVQNRIQTGKIPIYGANGVVGYHNESKAEYGIITGRSGSIGEVFMSNKPFWPLNTSLFSVDTHGNNVVYLMFLMRNYDLLRFKQGAGVPTLNRNSFHQNDIIDVPLTLQKLFASKIEAIEHQKELIKQSIKEVETLFDSRMDYYFN